MFNNGSAIVKVDFHMHTMADKEFSYSGDTNYFVSDYIQKMDDENIAIGIITNHNKFAKSEYDQLRKAAKENDFTMDFQKGLNVIIGANNDGKTGFLHAITLLKDPSDISVDDFNKNNQERRCIDFRELRTSYGQF